MDSNRAILDAFLNASPRGLARAITLCEAGIGAPLISALHERVGRAITVGLTGPPGVGKSTLTGALIRKARSLELRVGVVSVDPSSPFSRGALLGDRIRLTEHFVDPGVFIRSMASRGHLGGLAGATADAVALMDAFGFDLVIVETVGVGQSEIEIADIADTVIVALQPGSGDSVQTLKAGILEIADIFVVNKADHPNALQLQKEIRSMLEMLEYSGWQARLLATQALTGTGIDELWEAISEHASYLRESGELLRKRRLAFARRVRQLVVGRIEGVLDLALSGVVSDGTDPSQEDPYVVAERVLKGFLRDPLPPRASIFTPRRGRAHVKGGIA